MNKFVYFLMVGFAFVALQVATVEADMIPGTDCAATPGGPDAVAACWAAQTAGGGGDHPCSGMTGDALIKCTEENPPPSGTSEAGAPPVLTIDDPLCTVAPADRDPGCPPMAPPTTAAGTPPMCPGPLGTMIPCPAPGDGGPPPCPEGTVCDDPCISLETQALKDACHAEHSDEHGQVDCADPAHAAMPACTGG